MTDNFFGYILDGITQMLSGVLSQLPLGAVNQVLANGAVMLHFAVAPILFFIGPFFNLQFAATVIGLVLTLETVRIVIAGIRLIYKLIPAAA